MSVATSISENFYPKDWQNIEDIQRVDIATQPSCSGMENRLQEKGVVQIPTLLISKRETITQLLDTLYLD